jgi:hypothetical protein
MSKSLRYSDTKSLQGIRMERNKLKGILEWPTPSKVEDVHQLTGLTNYYRKYIERYGGTSNKVTEGGYPFPVGTRTTTSVREAQEQVPEERNLVRIQLRQTRADIKIQFGVLSPMVSSV